MSFLNVKNNASSKLAAAIDDDDLSLTVATGEGARFPSSNFHITIDDEILLCTSRTNDVLTVTRAQESTAAAAHSLGANVRLNITAAIIEELQTSVLTKTTGAITYYVDYEKGNDGTGDGTIGTPFKTLAHTLSLIPKLIAHQVTIYLEGDGGDPCTFAEDLVIAGFIVVSGVSLLIRGLTDTSANHLVQKITQDNCVGKIEVEYMKLTATSGCGIMCQNNSFGYYKEIECEGDACVYGFWGVYGGVYSLYACTFSYCTGAAILAQEEAIVYQRDCDGGGVNINATGLYAQKGGIIASYDADEPTGTTAHVVANGGLIIRHAGGEISGVNTGD